jgi:hypothetical protein
VHVPERQSELHREREQRNPRRNAATTEEPHYGLQNPVGCYNNQHPSHNGTC